MSYLGLTTAGHAAISRRRMHMPRSVLIGNQGSFFCNEPSGNT
jgi:hypothetical protein